MEGANAKALEQVVIESKNPEYCYLFAREVESANIKELKKVVIDGNDPEWCYNRFVECVEGENIKKIKQKNLSLKNNY